MLTPKLAYFEQVHPIHPFLDRKWFEEKAFSPQLSQFLSSSAPFSALYHTVLALGCQYQEGGTFEPGKGKTWKLFQIALGLFPDILVPRESLVNVQVSRLMNCIKCIRSSLTRHRPSLRW